MSLIKYRNIKTLLRSANHKNRHGTEQIGAYLKFCRESKLLNNSGILYKIGMSTEMRDTKQKKVRNGVFSFIN